MRFSIIIPVYNVEKYLVECLDSILNQTFQDFEIILIDDGSTDKSGEICDCYEQNHSEHIKAFHQHNCGVSKSRFNGLKNANGEICIFVDSDDALRLDALEKINDTFKNARCDLVLYDMTYDAGFVSGSCRIPFENGRCFEGADKQELYRIMIGSSKLNPIWMKAAIKSVYDAFLQNYNANEDITNGEDLYLSLPLVTHAKKIACLSETLYFYRQHETSMVHSFSANCHRSIKMVRLELEKYIQLWGMQECYPVFYANVVSIWIQTLKSLLKNMKSMQKTEVNAILYELSSDTFFRNAYQNMQSDLLSPTKKILAKWLYRGKLLRLRTAGSLFYSAKQIYKAGKQR